MFALALRIARAQGSNCGLVLAHEDDAHAQHEAQNANANAQHWSVIPIRNSKPLYFPLTSSFRGHFEGTSDRTSWRDRQTHSPVIQFSVEIASRFADSLCDFIPGAFEITHEVHEAVMFTRDSSQMKFVRSLNVIFLF